MVDGASEYASLPLLFPALRQTHSRAIELMQPVKADLQPLAPVPRLARECEKSVHQLKLRGAHRVIVLLDREVRATCPGGFASAIESEVRARVDGVAVDVVVKQKSFENWLLAHLAALAAHPRRFTVSRGTRRLVEPNKADNVEGLALLRRCVRGDYNKVADAKRILSSADPMRMAEHFFPQLQTLPADARMQRHIRARARDRRGDHDLPRIDASIAMARRAAASSGYRFRCSYVKRLMVWGLVRVGVAGWRRCQMRRARWRLRQRIASRLVLPSARLRAM